MCYVPKFPIIGSAAGTELAEAVRALACVALRVELGRDMRLVRTACRRRDLHQLAEIVAWVRDCGPVATQPGGMAYDLAAGLIERFRFEQQRTQLWAELDHLLPAVRVISALKYAWLYTPSREFYDAIKCELMSALHEREIYLPDYETLTAALMRTPR